MTSTATELVAHWGYGAIFVAVLLGNVGVPIPEETILALSGYLAQRGISDSRWSSWSGS
jgi:membrane protein DedA with SNARE-associated domain